MIGPSPPSISASGVKEKVYRPAMHWVVEHCVRAGCLQRVFNLHIKCSSFVQAGDKVCYHSIQFMSITVHCAAA